MTNGVEGGTGGIQGPVNGPGGHEQHIGGPAGPVDSGAPFIGQPGEQGMQGPTTRWDEASRTLHTNLTVPISPYLRAAGIRLGAADLSVTGIGAGDAQLPQLQREVAITAPSEEAAREVFSRHHLSVEQRGDTLDVESTYEPSEHTVHTVQTQPDGSVSVERSVTVTFGETGATVIPGFSGRISMEGDKMMVNGMPIDEVAGDHGVHEQVHETVALFVRGEGPMDYDLVTTEGAVNVQGVRGYLGVQSDRGSLSVNGFEGTVGATVGEGSVQMENTTIKGHSAIIGNTIDVSVLNDSLEVIAETVDGRVHVPGEDFTVAKRSGGSRLFGIPPRRVTGYFGTDATPADIVELHADNGITVARNPQG